MNWQEAAACRNHDPKVFFPSETNLRSVPLFIKHLCETCPVRLECLALAVEVATFAESGFWAGTTPGERREIARQRRREEALV